MTTASDKAKAWLGNAAGRRFVAAFLLPWVCIPALVAEGLWRLGLRCRR